MTRRRLAARLRARSYATPRTTLASPLRADLRGLPPTLIQAGADELLRRDAVDLHDALEKAGVAVRCELVPRRWHAFQLHAGMLPSADAALARAAQFNSCPDQATARSSRLRRHHATPQTPHRCDRRRSR